MMAERRSNQLTAPCLLSPLTRDGWGNGCRQRHSVAFTPSVTTDDLINLAFAGWDQDVIRHSYGMPARAGRVCRRLVS